MGKTDGEMTLSEQFEIALATMNLRVQYEEWLCDHPDGTIEEYAKEVGLV